MKVHVAFVFTLVYTVIVDGSTTVANVTKRGSNSTDHCTFTVWSRSKHFYESRLIAFKPNFVHFMLTLENNRSYNSTPNVFRPLHWVWTYKSPTASYPYLNWNIDHGLLSFGLLDVKTVNIPFVKMHVPPNCPITLGSKETTERIVDALKDLIINMSDQSYHKYEESFFCYLAVDPSVRESVEYQAALYLNYPVSFLNYKCCSLWYSYVSYKYLMNCTRKNEEKWIQCTVGPYILGIMIFMYFPLVLLEISAWISRGDKVERHEFELKSKTREEYESLHEDTDEWIFLDGKPPLTLLETFSVFFCGLAKKHPIAASRVRRVIGIFLAPSIIFIQLGMYAHGIGSGHSDFIITVPQIVEHGTPMGFLSLLAHQKDRHKYFAPMLGGPMCVLIMYYLLGIVFVVLPRSLKQIVERGMPSSNIRSPLFLHVDEIIKLSMLSISPEPGYENGAAVCKCGIYMIFNKMFWLRVLEIQRSRIQLNCFEQTRFTCCLKVLFLPLYLLLCLIEIACCIVFYGIPVFGFVTIMVKGAVKSFFMFRLHNRYITMVFRNMFTVCLGTTIVLFCFLFFVYSVCLIFVQSFSFISQIIIFCFVAVIVYPSVAFGYLFFFVVLLYYIVRLVKDFGDGYLELLSIAVEKSHDICYDQVNHITVFDDQLILSNFQAHGIKRIRINNQVLDIPQNVLQRLDSGPSNDKIREQENVFGIPKRLFEVLVRTYKPVHIQILKIFIQLALVVFLVVITMSITSKFATGATSEISDVMHVVFIVTVGALPRVLEVALMNSNETVKREIEIRRIEQSIKEFWLLEGHDGFTLEP